MKKTLSFEKDLTFQTMIGEITTISMEEDLQFVDKSNIEGNFYINGKYKMTEASTIQEDFSFSVPIEIAMIENYELSTTKISVENFTYEIVDDDVLRCKIDVLVEGREEVVLEDENKKELLEEIPVVEENREEILSEERECDGDIVLDSEKEIPIKEENNEEKKEEKEEEERELPVVEEKQKKELENKEEEKTPTLKVNSLFANLGEDNDTFTTYSVYIMREGDSLEKVMDKYQVKKEDLEIYNDLSTIELNSKVIIPSSSSNE